VVLAKLFEKGITIMTNIYSPIESVVITTDYSWGIPLKCVKTEEEAIVPSMANKGDAGYDLYALEETIVPARGRAIIKTGISMAVPEGHVALIWPRSGLAVKHGIDTLAGVIDSGYRGEVCVVLQNHTDSNYTAKKHDRIAQMLIQKITPVSISVVSTLDDSSRGTGGFGSSGK
jgi:deoxyuridine 5'-triphosphate nucleotidohydrolase